jgi:hypothetical protein
MVSSMRIAKLITVIVSSTLRIKTVDRGLGIIANTSELTTSVTRAAIIAMVLERHMR